MSIQDPPHKKVFQIPLIKISEPDTPLEKNDPNLRSILAKPKQDKHASKRRVQFNLEKQESVASYTNNKRPKLRMSGSLENIIYPTPIKITSPTTSLQNSHSNTNINIIVSPVSASNQRSQMMKNSFSVSNMSIYQGNPSRFSQAVRVPMNALPSNDNIANWNHNFQNNMVHDNPPDMKRQFNQQIDQWNSRFQMKSPANTANMPIRFPKHTASNSSVLTFPNTPVSTVSTMGMDTFSVRKQSDTVSVENASRSGYDNFLIRKTQIQGRVGAKKNIALRPSHSEDKQYKRLDENEYEVDHKYFKDQDMEAVKNLEKWEQRNKENALNLYALNLIMKLQGTILKSQSKIPSINMNNINAINYNHGDLIKDSKIRPSTTSSARSTGFSSRSSTMGSNPFLSKTKEKMQKEMMNKISSMQRIKSHNLLLRGGEGEIGSGADSVFSGGREPIKSTAKQGDLQSMFAISDELSLKEKKKIEDEMFSEYCRLKSRLQEVKQSLKEIFAQNNELYEKISTTSEAMEVEESDYKKQTAESKGLLESKIKNKKQITIHDFIKIQGEREKRQKQKELQIKFVSDLKIHLQTNKEKIFYYEEELKLVKNEIVFVKNIQKDYYIKLLKKGVDTRGKGLIWIVQKLFLLNIPVDHSMFPKYLEYESKHFILQLAKKDFQLNEIKEKLSAAKANLADFQFSTSSNKKIMEYLNTTNRSQLLNKILMEKNQKLRAFSSQSKFRKKLTLARREDDGIQSENHDYFHIQEMGIQRPQTFQAPRSHPKSESGEELTLGEIQKVLDELETKMKRIKRDIENCKDGEARRILKVFNIQPISHQAKMRLKQVTNSLFGDSNYHIELIKKIQQV